MSEDISSTPTPLPFKKPRKRSAKEKLNKNKPLPPPADKETAKKVLDHLVNEATNAVVKGSGLGVNPSNLPKTMTPHLRANLLSMLGPDIESARQYFADKLLSTANAIHDRIADEINELPHSTLAFTMSVMMDKSEMLRQKAGAVSAGSKVNQQVNVFMSGEEDREKIIAQLTGAAWGVGGEKPVEPVNVEAKESTG